ncbi:MAG: ATP-grasp domain-containing protein [Lachnospiraceae bacterium]|nr:ATP-grasp domain-containing protein [Lachnospiraceae bacterium]
MKKVLVTAIGSMSADIVIKVLHKEGYYVIGTDIYPKEWVVDARNVDEFYNVPPAAEQNCYINRILEICRERKVDYICPLTDDEIDVFNENRQKFENLSILCMSDYDVINICRNKKKTADTLKGTGLCNVIWDYGMEDIEKHNICFPVVGKPVRGRSSQGFRIFTDEEEFYGFCRKVKAGEYLFQPYIAGNVITVDVVRDKRTGCCAAAARRELLRTLNGAGLSVQVFREEALEKVCEDLAESLGITGCVNFEFLETEDGVRYLLECNPRFSGGVEFSVLSGYDFVRNHMRCFENKPIETKICIREHWICRKYEEYITD